MNSPFPGMDPFIEASHLWEDFHNHLVEAVASALADAVPSRYFVASNVRNIFVTSNIDSVPCDEHVSIPSNNVKDSDVVSLRSILSESFRETFVEIHSVDEGRELVTCVEVLSPSNKKPGSEGWELYLRKRQALLLGQANLVEIDLLRGGRRMPMLDPWPTCPFTVLASRRMRTPHCRVWKGWMHKPLPTIDVPLAADDPDVSLAIQPLVDEVYRRYRYDRQIDYSKPCRPPLSDEEDAWLREQLRGRVKETVG